MPSHVDLDRQIEHLMECKPLQEVEVKTLCDQARAILIEEWNIQPVKCPVTANEPTSSSSFLFIIGVMSSVNEPRSSYLGVMF